MELNKDPKNLKEMLTKAVEKKSLVNAPRIYDYMDYREFLGDYYTYNKKQNPYFSYGTFANKGKFQTRNYLKRVIDGERPITSENFPKFCLALGFNAKESQYFEALVNYNQAKDPVAKKYYFEHLKESAAGVKSSAVEITANQMEVFSKWYNLPVFESLAVTNIDHTPENISKIFRKKITPKEVKSALETLEKAGLIYFDNINQRYFKSIEQVRYTQNGVNLAMREFHKQTLANVIDFIDDEPLEARYLRSLTVAIGSRHLETVHKEVDAFVKGLHNKYAALKEDKEMIIQLNLNVCNLTKNNKEEKKL